MLVFYSPYAGFQTTNTVQRLQSASAILRYDTTLFNYAGHTQQKLVSRWGVGKHVRISYVCMDVLKINTTEAQAEI